MCKNRGNCWLPECRYRHPGGWDRELVKRREEKWDRTFKRECEEAIEEGEKKRPEKTPHMSPLEIKNRNKEKVLVEKAQKDRDANEKAYAEHRAYEMAIECGFNQSR